MNGPDEQKLQIGFGKFNLSTQGLSTILMLVLLANILVTIWAGRLILETTRKGQGISSAEHQEIIKECLKRQ